MAIFWKMVFFRKMLKVGMLNFLHVWKSEKGLAKWHLKKVKSLKSLYRSTFFHSRLPKTGYFCHFWPKSQKKGQKTCFLTVCSKKTCNNINFLGLLPSLGVVGQQLFHLGRYEKTITKKTVGTFAKRYFLQKNGFFLRTPKSKHLQKNGKFYVRFRMHR